MKSFHRTTFYLQHLFLALILVGCSVPFAQSTPSVTAELPTPTVTVTSSPAAALEPQGTTTPPGPVTLRVWVPPQFDPAFGTRAGNLFQERLDEFGSRRPGVRVEVRVKAVDGPGGLLDSLTAASAAAPLALPDLIALPRAMLEAAALKGLLHPFEGVTTVMEDPDWYEYSRQLARLQSSTFGLPFAGDALILVYRPAVIAAPPIDWPAALQTTGPLVFSAADQQALFTIALYQAAGGEIRDDQGRPFLDANVLAQVLAFYQEAEQAGLMPYWLTQYQSDNQVWEAFLENRTDLVVTWASRFLTDLLADTAVAPIPTTNGTSFTLATGWVWALAAPKPEHQLLSAQLAEFLTESSFLAEWTEAAGYLPPRPSALEAWSNTSLQSLIGPVALSASLYPSTDVLTSLGPHLEQATVAVLKQQIDPLTAAQTAVANLSGP